MLNRNVRQNGLNKVEISNKFKVFIENTNAKIEKLYTKETERIRSNFTAKNLDEKLNDLYRSYYINNQDKIVKYINKMFKEKNFNIKLFIL